MFFVTGDVHANWKDFYSRPFGKLKKDDYVIVCGDFGILWDGSDEENKAIKHIGREKHTTLFVDGAHENFDLLRKYPVTEWNGGKVQIISGNLIHLVRGQVFGIAGRKIFAFGGGESTDKEMREENVSWWPEEIPSMEEMKEGVNNLVANNWQVDYIITHEAPSSFKKFLEEEPADLNGLNVYLDYIREKCHYRKWIFGNYHINKRLSISQEVVFDDVVKLN